VRSLKLEENIRQLKNAKNAKLTCNFDLPQAEELHWDEEPVIFDRDPMNRPYEIIEIRRKY